MKRPALENIPPANFLNHVPMLLFHQLHDGLFVVTVRENFSIRKPTRAEDLPTSVDKGFDFTGILDALVFSLDVKDLTSMFDIRVETSNHEVSKPPSKAKIMAGTNQEDRPTCNGWIILLYNFLPERL